MPQRTERLERYLEDELGDCRDEEVEKRLGELDALRESAEACAEQVDVLSALATRHGTASHAPLSPPTASYASVNSTPSSTFRRAA